MENAWCFGWLLKLLHEMQYKLTQGNLDRGRLFLGTIRRLLAWRPGGYVRASIGLFGWLLLRAAAQAVLVLALARLLGATGYGQFVAILAVASFFAPLVGLGLQGVVLRDGARAPAHLPGLLGDSLALWWRAALVFGALALFATLWLLPDGISAYAVAAFVLAEVASSSLVDIIGRAEQALHHSHVYGAIMAGLVFARLVALSLLVVFDQPDVSMWLWLYALASMLYALALCAWTVARHRPLRTGMLRWGLVREGTSFIVGALSFRLQAEFNKPLLAQASYSHAGNFSVAQRVVDLASLPLQAMQEALWPRFYAGSHPPHRMRIVAGVLVVLAVLGGAALVLAAPWLSLAIGESYGPVEKMLVYLAWLPALQVVRNLLIAAIIKRGMQSYLNWIYLIAGMASLALNIVLVPVLGLLGAVWALYLNEFIMSMMLLYRLNNPNGIYRRPG